MKEQHFVQVFSSFLYQDKQDQRDLGGGKSSLLWALSADGFTFIFVINLKSNNYRDNLSSHPGEKLW